MTGIAVKNEGMFDQYEDDDMLMVMSLAEYWEIINRLKMLDDRMIGMRRLMGNMWVKSEMVIQMDREPSLHQMD